MENGATKKKSGVEKFCSGSSAKEPNLKKRAGGKVAPKPANPSMHLQSVQLVGCNFLSGRQRRGDFHAAGASTAGVDWRRVVPRVAKTPLNLAVTNARLFGATQHQRRVKMEIAKAAKQQSEMASMGSRFLP